MRLQRDLQKLALVIDALPFIVAYVDRNQIYRLVNATLTDWFGTTQDQVLGRKVSEFLSDQQYRVVEPFLRRALDGEPVDFETELWYPKRGPAHVSVHYAPDRDAQGVVNGTTILVNDISKRRALESELEGHRKLLQTVNDNTSSAIFMLNPSGHPVFMNTAAHRVTGFFLDDISSRPLTEVLLPTSQTGDSKFKDSLSALVCDQAGKHIDAVSFDMQSLKRLQTQTRPVRSDESLRRKNGEIFPATCTLTPIFEANRFTGCVFEFQDCSQVKEVERALRSARDAAESTSRAKMQFLANMSHEIRTPMNSILGFADLLRSPGLSEQDRRDFTERICNNGAQLQMLIDDILDLSKFEAGKFTVVLEPVDICHLISLVIKTFELQAKTKRLRLELEESPSRIPMVISDGTRLRQILNNLVNNAIKFTCEGQITIRLRHEMKGSRAHVTVEVQDTGIGIRPEDQNKLFRAFGQADPSIARNYGGTGLGLCLSRRLARALDGELALRWSACNQGSCFALEFDAAVGGMEGVDERAAKVSRVTLERVAANGNSHSRLAGRILLAEDSVDNEALVRQYLRDQDIEVVAVHNGFEVLDQFEKNKFDLILMDVQMPGMDGLTATTELRNRGVKNPILALSAHALPEEIDRSLRAGCDAHLTKPLSKSSLCNALGSYLRPPHWPQHH